MGDQEIISMAPANEFIDANIVNEKKGDPSSGLCCSCCDCISTWADDAAAVVESIGHSGQIFR